MAFSMLVTWLSGRLGSLGRNEDGADAIEYLLTIAVICVAVVLGVASGLPTSWLGTLTTGVCTAVDTAFPAMGLACSG
jgi:Flp pilus assembly pilin Flp